MYCMLLYKYIALPQRVKGICIIGNLWKFCVGESFGFYSVIVFSLLGPILSIKKQSNWYTVLSCFLLRDLQGPMHSMQDS